VSIDITITADLPPKGKGRPRVAIQCGHAHAYTPEPTRRWEAQLAALASTQLPSTAIDGPVRVDILAIEARPQRLLKRWARPRPDGHGDGTWAQPMGLLWRPTRPDADNVRKSVLDALCSFWRDDSQVVRGETLSLYAEVDGRARVVVRIRDDVGDPVDAVAALGMLGR